MYIEVGYFIIFFFFFFFRLIKKYYLFFLLIDLADCYIRISSGLNNLATAEQDSLSRFMKKISDNFETARKTEGRVSSDTDLKLSDTLRYYMRDSKAALDLLYRRSRRLADLELENKNLDKAISKRKDEDQVRKNREAAKDKFENISEVAKNGNFEMNKITLIIQINQFLSFI
jgi:predicted  nucleic acid-binding Zn-ribbon protein